MIELDVDEIGASLKFTTLKLPKTERVTAQAPTSDPNPPAPRGAVVTYGGERPSISSPS